MKNLKKITYFILSIFLITSCVKDDVENFKDGAYIVGFKKNSDFYSFSTTQTDPIVIKPIIDLIGGKDGTTSQSNIKINFTLDPQSTAIEGSDFSFNSNEKSITLESGEEFTALPITVNPVSLPGNIPRTIILNLTEVNSTNSSTISGFNKKMTITLAKCESDLAGNYTLRTQRTDNGEEWNFTNEEIFTTDVLGEYLTSSTAECGEYALGAGANLIDEGASRNGFIFNDLCGDITVPAQGLGDYFNNLVISDPNKPPSKVTINPVTGKVASMVIYYTVDYQGTNFTYTATYTKKN